MVVLLAILWMGAFRSCSSLNPSFLALKHVSLTRCGTRTSLSGFSRNAAESSSGEEVEATITVDTRRRFLKTMVVSTGVSTFCLSTPAGIDHDNNMAHAVETTTPINKGLVSASDLLSRLHAVPTFTLVDERGVPFMVFGEDAKLTAYFFTTYSEASRILNLALQSSEKNRAERIEELQREESSSTNNNSAKNNTIEKEIGVNVWNTARISTVPLDFAVTLATKGELGGSHFVVAPDEHDMADALAIEKAETLAEGKVPIFYIEDFELITTDDNNTKQSPVYFQKEQLLSAWKEKNPTVEQVDVKVSELFSVMTEMVKPGGTEQELKHIVFVPPVESAEKAEECTKNGNREDPFVLGERIVVF